LELNEEKYVEQFGAGMIDVVYKWCRGHTFAEIMKDTELFEGLIFKLNNNKLACSQF
jgi:superfamily II RNA helicase